MNGYVDSTGSVNEGYATEQKIVSQSDHNTVNTSNNVISSNITHNARHQGESSMPMPPADSSVNTWRMSNELDDLSPMSTFALYHADDIASDDDDDDYGSDRLGYNLELSDDQKQATSELYNLKLDLGFSAVDGDGQNLDMSERVRQLNDELLNDPLPADVENRTRSIKFKDALVDFISPTPEPDADLGLYYGFSDTVETFQEDIPETPRDSRPIAVENQPSEEMIPRSTTDSDVEKVPTTFVYVAEQKSESQLPHAVDVKLSDSKSEQRDSSLCKLTPHDLLSLNHSDCDNSESSIQKNSSSSPKADFVQEHSSKSKLMSSTSHSSVSQEDTHVKKHYSTSSNVSSDHSPDRSKTDEKQTEIVDAVESHVFNDVTLVEKNGKFRLITSDELKAVKNCRSQSATTPLQSEKCLLQPRPPATPRPPPVTPRHRAPMTDRGYSPQQYRFSSRRTMSARGAGSSMSSIKQNSPERKSAQVKEEEERKKKKRDEANAAFKAWLRQKRVEAETRRNRASVQGDQTTNNTSNEEDSVKKSFDEWVKKKEAQQRREQRLEEAQRNYLAASGNTHSQHSDRAFRQWLKRKQQEGHQRREQERQRMTFYSLVARRSRKSLALAKAMSLAHTLRFAEYWTHDN